MRLVTEATFARQVLRADLPVLVCFGARACQARRVMLPALESVAAKDLHELLRSWELKHRHRAAECVTQHTLFRRETRWPGYYYRGDAMKVDDENWHVLTVSRRDPETGEYTMEKAPCYHLVAEEEQTTGSRASGQKLPA